MHFRKSPEDHGKVASVLGGGFSNMFTSIWEDSHFDSYFSNGLKPPTSVSTVRVYAFLGANGWCIMRLSANSP